MAKTKTDPNTVARMIQSLITDHCENNDPEMPQVMGQTDGSEANVIEAIAVTAGPIPAVRLKLDDGTHFRVEIHKVLKG